MSAAVEAWLGLGSNLGDRRASLLSACELLEAAEGIRSLRRSSIIETAPQGPPGAPALGGPYLNAVVEVVTTLGPEALLELCLDVERHMGRVRSTPNAPRSIDVDLLLWGDEVRPPRPGDGLILPHPRMLERRFVLQPLAELRPELRHPTSGRTIAEHLEQLAQRDGDAATSR